MRELLQQLRDALVEHTGNYKLYGEALEQHRAAIAAATAELEKPEPEPVGYFHEMDDAVFCKMDKHKVEYCVLSGLGLLYKGPPSESEAVALLREIVSRFDAAYPIPLVVDMQLKNKIDAILKGQP